MRKLALLALILSLSITGFAEVRFVEIYPNGDRVVGVFTNLSDAAASDLLLSFTGAVDVIQAITIGGMMSQDPSDDPSTVRFSGTLNPMGSLIIEWETSGAQLERVSLSGGQETLTSLPLLYPFARLSISGDRAGQSILFQGSRSFDPKGLPLASYAWSWSDGVTSSGRSAQRTFETEGTYTVELTVTNEDGRSNTTSQRFSILPPEEDAGSGDGEGPAAAVVPEIGDILIVQVLANASGSPEIPNEFIRLQNVSDHPLNIAGCEISDEGDHWWEIPTTAETSSLAPGAMWTAYGSDTNPTNSSSGISLRNTGELVSIRLESTLLDSWDYPGGSSDGEILTRP